MDAVDVVVVGGGPGGLTTALYLARLRRRVLVIDDGRSRLGRIPRSHNYPGFAGGVPGAELLRSIRQQADHHGVQHRVGRVEAVRQERGRFTVTSATDEISTRFVVLATGVSDIEPAMPYAADALREGALRYCPICDGYEVIDQRVGVLVDSSGDVGEAIYLRHFTPHLTLFKASADVQFDAAQSRRLADAGIVQADGPVSSIRLWNGVITVTHGARETACDSLYAALGLRVHADLALALSAQCDDAGYLVVDAHGQTSVRGLYAVGDVTQGVNQISVATGSAAKAASAIHLALLKGAEVVGTSPPDT